LGSLYLTGVGVVRDKEQGARWLRSSAESRNQAAQVDLANLVLEGAGVPEDPSRIAGWLKQAAAEGDLPPRLVKPPGRGRRIASTDVLRAGALRYGFQQALGSFGFRRENCDQAISINIDEGGYRASRSRIGLPALTHHST
jgi:TPR repeat protein